MWPHAERRAKDAGTAGAHRAPRLSWRGRLAAAEIGDGGLSWVQGNDRRVGNAPERQLPVLGTGVEGRSDDHPVADDQRRQRPGLDALQGGVDAHLLLGEGLAAGEGEAGIGGGERVEQLRRFGADVGERAVGPLAGVGLHQARVLDGLEADARGDDVGGFARAQQRAAPQRAKAVGDGALGQLRRLGAAGVVERHLLLALEAAFVVVGGLAVAGEVDAFDMRGAQPALGQDRSKRSRFMTLSQAATKSPTNFSSASSQA